MIILSIYIFISLIFYQQLYIIIIYHQFICYHYLSSIIYYHYLSSISLSLIFNYHSNYIWKNYLSINLIINYIL